MSEDNIIPFESGLVEDVSIDKEQAVSIMSEAVYNQADVLCDRVNELIKKIGSIRRAVEHARDVTLDRSRLSEPELDGALRDLALVRDLVDNLERAMLE